MFRAGSLFAGDEAGSLCRSPAGATPHVMATWPPDHLTTWPPDHLTRWSPNLELQNKMEYYTEIWSLAVDSLARRAYTARWEARPTN